MALHRLLAGPRPSSLLSRCRHPGCARKNHPRPVGENPPPRAPLARHRRRQDPHRRLLLKRLFDAGAFAKALFVCDRTELRDNGLGDFQAAFGTNAAEVDTKHPQKNARVLIATYQTLDHKFEHGKSPQNAVENFFKRHYPPGYFDLIVIDECHRSAWGDWFDIIRANADGIHVGLTATPRQIKLPETDDEQTRKEIESDRRACAPAGAWLRRHPRLRLRAMVSGEVGNGNTGASVGRSSRSAAIPEPVRSSRRVASGPLIVSAPFAPAAAI